MEFGLTVYKKRFIYNENLTLRIVLRALDSKTRIFLLFLVSQTRYFKIRKSYLVVRRAHPRLENNELWLVNL